MGKQWFITSHACHRGATRFGLIIDKATEGEIAKALDSDLKVFIRHRKGCDIYEIPLLGKSAIAVCDMVNRVVLTLMDPKSYFTKTKRVKLRTAYNRNKPMEDDDDGEWKGYRQERWSS